MLMGSSLTGSGAAQPDRKDRAGQTQTESEKRSGAPTGAADCRNATPAAKDGQGSRTKPVAQTAADGDAAPAREPAATGLEPAKTRLADALVENRLGDAAEAARGDIARDLRIGAIIEFAEQGAARVPSETVEQTYAEGGSATTPQWGAATFDRLN